MAELKKSQEFEDAKERYYKLEESTFQKLAEQYIEVLEIRIEELEEELYKWSVPTAGT